MNIMKKNKTNPFAGIILGIIFIIGGTILLWWNEGNNVANIQKIKDISENAVDVVSDTIDSQYEGRLIATNGSLLVEDEKIEDSTFHVGLKTPVLRRVVEIYQWEEIENNNDDGTSYSYQKTWASKIIDSSNFHKSGYTNPNYMQYESQKINASSVKVGAYRLTNSQIVTLATNKTLTLDNSVIIPSGYNVSGQYITNASNLASPEIGDIRISWEYNDYKDISVLAMQSGDSFTDYISSSGKIVNRIEEGLFTKNQIIKHMQDEDNLLKWILRLTGILIISVGYILTISPITTLASYIPILGGIVGGVLSFILFLIGLIHSLLIITIAWIRFRPLLGISLLAICVGLVFIIKTLIKKQSTKKDLNIATNANAIPSQEVVSNNSVNSNINNIDNNN